MFLRKALHYIVIAASLFVVKTPGVEAKPITNVVRWAVEKNSTLRVNGTSNVNSFTCNIKEYLQKDTIILFNDPSKPKQLTGELQMDVRNVNCHSNLITKDLRKTLKAEEYPN
ncbi:MAG: hypothetical protein WKF91_20630, partial [Segetibacter sp.]